MNSEEMSIFRFSVAVAVASMEDVRPRSGDITGECACSYLREILEMVFAHTGVEFSVRSLPYPPSSKVPMIITVKDAGQCLFWFHPSASICAIASDLEGALHDIVQNVFCVRAERSVPV